MNEWTDELVLSRYTKLNAMLTLPDTNTEGITITNCRVGTAKQFDMLKAIRTEAERRHLLDDQK